MQIPTRAQYEELERRYREAQVRREEGGHTRRSSMGGDRGLHSVSSAHQQRPTINSTPQRALWATKESLRAKAHALREAKHARAEEERVVRRWQVWRCDCLSYTYTCNDPLRFVLSVSIALTDTDTHTTTHPQL